MLSLAGQLRRAWPGCQSATLPTARGLRGISVVDPRRRADPDAPREVFPGRQRQDPRPGQGGPGDSLRSRSKRDKSEKDTYCIISLTCGI